jgi:bifunctional non-homologous end joining protein LigD
MLSVAVPKLPEGPEWAYEVKFDGYRAQAIKTAGRVQLRSRYGANFNERFPSITHALQALPDETVIDGEIVAYDAEGHPSFNVLQNHLSEKPRLQFFAFDLMFHRGSDLMHSPLEDRRRLLQRKVVPLLPDIIRFSETLEASAAEVVEAIREMGLEGVVAKRRESRYEPGRRSGAWQKMRINQVGEFVIGGYTPGGRNFDALLVGRREGRKLVFVGKIRAGFTPALRDAVFARLTGLEAELCPFANLPESHHGRWGEGLTAEEMVLCRWVKPRLRASVAYLEVTAANHLRHAKFVSLLKRG